MSQYYAKIVSADRKHTQYAYRYNRAEIRYVAKLARKLGNRVEVYKLTKI